MAGKKLGHRKNKKQGTITMIDNATGESVPIQEVAGVLVAAGYPLGTENTFSLGIDSADINGGDPVCSMSPGRDNDPDPFIGTKLDDGGDPNRVRAEWNNLNFPDLFSGAGYTSALRLGQMVGDTYVLLGELTVPVQGDW